MTSGTEPRPGHTPHPFVGGRDAVLRLLADWRSGRPGTPRTVVLTGTPGAGRTRLIAGFVMLCDEELRQRLPLAELDPEIVPPDLPDALLALRPDRLSVEQFPAALAAGLGLALPEDPAAHMAELAAGLAALAAPTALVVPDIDRADARAVGGAARLVRDVLNPLARTENVRLLLDLPRERVGDLLQGLPADTVRVVDVDEPQWWDTDGLARQAEAALDPRSGAPELPFTTDDTVRTALARAIAQRAGHRALVMDLVVRGLFAVPEGFDPADAEQRLPATVGRTLEWHAERAGTDAAVLRTALTPLALGSADGMPQAVWRRLVAAVDDRADAEALLGSPALEPFVATGPGRGEDTRLTLRHPAIGDEVRAGLKNVRDLQTRIAMALLEAVPEQNWARADGYVRDHIAEHTLEAGLLPQLLTDPGLFAHADPERMLAAVAAAPPESLGAPAGAYLRTAPLLTRTAARPPLRAALLDTAFTEDGLGAYAGALHRLGMDLPWRTLWTLVVPGVRAVAAGTLLPPEDPDSAAVGLAVPAAVLVVPADTPGALPLKEGGEAGLLVRDLRRAAPLEVPDLERLALPSEDARKASPLAFAPGPHAVRVQDRSEERELATYWSRERIVDADISPEGILLVLAGERVTALSVRRAP